MSLRTRLQLVDVVAVAFTLTLILALDESSSLRELFLPGVIAALAALVFAAFASARPKASIDEMTETARALSRGDLSVRAPLSAPGELGELGSALGRLADQLASRIGTLKQEQALLASLVDALDEGVVTIDARRNITRINSAARQILGISKQVPFSSEMLPRSPELLQALDQAARGKATDPVECAIGSRTVSLTARPLPSGDGIVLAMFDLTRMKQLEAVRRDFVANVSHELRTPLTVISGFAETLDDDDVPPEMSRQFIGSIRLHAERMQQMVDDLLDLSRLESGKWSPQLTRFLFTEVADEVVTVHWPAAETRGLALTATIPGDLELHADRTAVRQILSNLVDNAIRHTDSGTVTIYGTTTTDAKEIGVRDTGRGISQAHLSRIFERFYRADPGRARESGGTGLGLAIVKHLAEAHGGTVQATSKLGDGTTVTVTFPR